MSFIPDAAQHVETVQIRTDRDVARARRAASKAMDAIGAKSVYKARFVTAVSEIARNAFVHAGGGRLAVHRDAQAVYVICADDGSGIADVDAALEDGYSTSNSLGKGLGGAKRLAKRFEIETGDTGTIVRMASA
ncbi:MAG: ATP-binding protein [Oceanicaulis sp.]